METTDAKIDRLLALVGDLQRKVEERPAPLPTVLTKRRAATELSVSPSKLKAMIRKGQIMTCEVGDSTGIPSSEVLRIASAQGRPKPERPARTPRPPRVPKGPTEAEKIRAALGKRR